MAANTEVATWNPRFIEKLIPCSKKISLLYHLSYLCLGKFPKVEGLLRMRAVETQLLFKSSEAVMLKCMGTSQNLVTSLFPMLSKAVEKQKPDLAKKYLEKAEAWINEIIKDVDDVVGRYEGHNKDVSETTSNIRAEKEESVKTEGQKSKEVEELEKTLKTLKSKMEENTQQLEAIKQKIKAKNLELNNYIQKVCSTSKTLGRFAAVIPFLGPLIQFIHDKCTDAGITKTIKIMEEELSRLNKEKNSMENTEWDLQVKMFDGQMKLTKANLERGSIPSPEHLQEVQSSLSRIQKILVQLKGFWENVRSLLGAMKQKTFVGDALVDDPEEKEDFLKSIQTASEIWGRFAVCCGKSVDVFRLESRDAYDFLEIDPSSLSPEEWQNQYDRVKEQLTEVKASGPDDATPAIEK